MAETTINTQGGGVVEEGGSVSTPKFTGRDENTAQQGDGAQGVASNMGVTGDARDSNFIAGERNRVTSDNISNVVNFQAPESFLYNVYYLLGELSRKIDSGNDRLTALNDRMRTVESDMLQVKSAQDERRSHGKEVDQRIASLEAQFAKMTGDVKREIRKAGQLVDRDRMVLWVVGSGLTIGVLIALVQEVFDWVR